MKLISINIEEEKHLDSVQRFLEQEHPDVVCMQEVHEVDLQEFARKLGMQAVMGQMSLMGRGDHMKPPFHPFGIGILSRFPIQNIRRAYYQEQEGPPKNYVFNGNPREDYHLLLYANIRKGNTNFTIGTTHFIWTPDGEADDLQRENLEKLLAILKDIPEFVFCGDFNAPRGREIFDTIAQHYKDNIPQQYTTSIDVNLHRLGEKLRGEPLMVDGIFSTRHYNVQNVRLVEGVSDHMAVVAEISKI